MSATVAIARRDGFHQPSKPAFTAVMVPFHRIICGPANFPHSCGAPMSFTH